MSTKSTLLVVPEFLERAASLPKDIKSKLVRVLWLLSQDFSHPSLQTKKVRGTNTDIYECRVDQGTRLIYDVRDGALRCWYVGDHDSALTFAASAEVDDIEIRDPSTDPVAMSPALPPLPLPAFIEMELEGLALQLDR